MSSATSVEALKAIAHPVRLKILQALGSHESNVGEIEASSGIGQPTLSQQLAVLRNARIVLTRKEAKLVFYRIDSSRLSEIATLISDLAGGLNTKALSNQTAKPGVANFARMLFPVSTYGTD